MQLVPEAGRARGRRPVSRRKSVFLFMSKRHQGRTEGGTPTGGPRRFFPSWVGGGSMGWAGDGLSSPGLPLTPLLTWLLDSCFSRKLSW